MQSGPPVSTVVIREMTTADIPAGLSLCRAARWNQTEQDWAHFLNSAPHGALAAVYDGRVVGTVATLPYGSFAWISMVLVDPSVRGQGIGTVLLQRGLELIPEDVTARLDATPAGEPIYRKMGFAGEYGISRWFRDRGAGAPRVLAGPPARPLQPSDWDGVREMDRRVFGESRAALLESLAARAPEYAWVLDEGGGRLRGYMFGRHGHVREHLGPLVAADDTAARLLVETCLAMHGDRPVFIDVPDDRGPFRDALAPAGFAVERPFLRMYRGTLTAPGDPSRIYAIGGPELG